MDRKNVENFIIRDFEDHRSRSLPEEVCSNLARQHAESFDGVIAEGLRRVTGDSDLKIEEFKGRLEWLHFLRFTLKL